MKKIILPLLLLAFTLPSFATDHDKVVDRLDEAASVLDDIMGAKDSGIPDEIISNSKCIAIVP